MQRPAGQFAHLDGCTGQCAHHAQQRPTEHRFFAAK